MIEAAIIGRPVFSMLAEEFAGTQEGTIHFHHLLPENGGCVRIASTIDEHVRQLSDRLRDPEAARAETQRFIGSFIRPAWHRPAGDADLRRRRRTAGRRAGAGASTPRRSGAIVLRPVVLAAAVPGCNRRLAGKAGPVEAAAQAVASIHVPQAKDRLETVAEVCCEATPCAAVDPLKST